MNRNIVKITIIGQIWCGKTSIISRYIYNNFSDGTQSTIGASYFSKKIETEKGIITLQLWDCSGQSRYESLMPMYLRNSKICLVVYSITDRNSFKKCQQYFDAVKMHDNNIIIILIGNKLDLESDREVEYAEASHCATQNGAKYFETSAKTGENITDLFDYIVNSYNIPVNMFVESSTIKLEDESVLKNKCCEH